MGHKPLFRFGVMLCCVLGNRVQQRSRVPILFYRVSTRSRYFTLMQINISIRYNKVWSVLRYSLCSELRYIRFSVAMASVVFVS